MIQKPQVIFVLGGPGAGKGTQCQKLQEAFPDVLHISAGDCLREERQNGSERGELIESYIRQGKIVPSEITTNLLKDKMVQFGWDNKKFLIDGFPRSHENLNGWNDVIGDTADLKYMLFFDCKFENMEERILSRSETSGRSDDNIESLKKRFVTYMESTQQIIDHFMSLNKCVTIDTNRSIEVIYEDLKNILIKDQFIKE